MWMSRHYDDVVAPVAARPSASVLLTGPMPVGSGS